MATSESLNRDANRHTAAGSGCRPCVCSPLDRRFAETTSVEYFREISYWKIDPMRFCVVIAAAVFVCSSSCYAQQEIAAYSGGSESRLRYLEHWAVCHGDKLQGAAQGTSLRADLRHGDSVPQVVAAIADGLAALGMPP